MKLISIVLILQLLSSCARVQTLNMAKHQYSSRADHIVWIQLAGFSEEHLPLLRFSIAEADYKTNIEQVDCAGKMWAYNLYDIRPNALQSFLSQSTGSKNIKGQCSDYEAPSSWTILSKIGYSSFLMESGASNEQSLQNSLQCTLNNVIETRTMRYYRMGPDISADVKTFHYQASPSEIKMFLEPGFYVDKSCQKGICYSSLSNNFKTLWLNSIKENSRSLFIVRDYNFYNALKKKDISLARESLQEIDRIVGLIQKSLDNNSLIILSGAESMPLEFPMRGKEWAEFESKGKNILYKNSSLFSPVLAKGAMAENFCGVFEESEMFDRLIYKPEKKVFDWDFLKPF